MKFFTSKKTVEKITPHKEKKQKDVVSKDTHAKVEKKEIKKSTPKKGLPQYQKEKHVIIRPLITEKVTALEGKDQYVFAVHTNVNKIEVHDEIKKIYDVTPVKVNIINVSGKKVRFGRTLGTTKKWKKAIVFLKKGDSINLTKSTK